MDVITAHPYYPEWRVHESYRGKGWCTERRGNLTVYRSPLYVPREVTGRSRILHELSFAATSLVHGVRCLFRKYDVVIGMCPPLLAGAFPYLFGRFRGVPFLFHVQDLQVDAARQLGMIRNQRLLNALDGVEKFLLQKADAVSSISEGMKRNILAKGVRPERYFMLPNWADTDFIRPLPPDESLRTELGIAPHEKVVLYSGNMGEKQGLEVILDAAALLTDVPNLRILLCGEGAARRRLVADAQSRGLHNVLFSPIRPYEQLPKVLATGDVHLVILKKSTSDLVMPSKLVSTLAAGGAAIVSAEPGTTLREVVENNDFGWAIEPESPAALAEAIREAVLSERLPTLRKNARLYAENCLSRTAILSKAEVFLHQLARKEPLVQNNSEKVTIS